MLPKCKMSQVIGYKGLLHHKNEDIYEIAPALFGYSDLGLNLIN